MGGPPRPHGFPVAAGAWPLLGHYPALNRDPWRFFHEQIDRYGDFFWLDRGFGAWTLIAHGEVAFNDLLTLNDPRRAERTLAREHVALQGSHVISALVGEEHRRVRRPILRALCELEQLAPMVEANAQLCVARLIARRGAQLNELCREFTICVVLGLLGIHAQHAPQWQRAFQRFTLGFVPLHAEFWGSPRWLALRAKDWIDARLLEQVELARADPTGPGLLRALVREQGDPQRGLSDPELLDNLRQLLTAGVHTTAQALTWILAHLATEPPLWRELVEELEGVEALPRTRAELAALPLLTGLLREAMRRRPLMIGLSRRAGEGLRVGGRAIPPGIRLTVPLPPLLTDPRRYFDPMRFDPHRWLDRPLDRIDTAGFGCGPHYCAGYLLTWLESSIFTATLVRSLTRAGLRLKMPRLPATRVLGPALEPVPAHTRARLEPLR